jgi:hypothetical protein
MRTPVYPSPFVLTDQQTMTIQLFLIKNRFDPEDPFSAHPLKKARPNEMI